jgi:hypothetical protein
MRAVSWALPHDQAFALDILIEAILRSLGCCHFQKQASPLNVGHG